MPFIEPGSPWENGYIESFNLKAKKLGRRYIQPFVGGGSIDNSKVLQYSVGNSIMDTESRLLYE